MAISTGNSKRGGSRPGAGRKTSLITKARVRMQEEKIADAELAYSYFVEWMTDETQDVEFRKDCAAEIMNRVWGKPKQVVAGDSQEPLKIVVEYVNGD